MLKVGQTRSSALLTSEQELAGYLANSEIPSWTLALPNAMPKGIFQEPPICP